MKKLFGKIIFFVFSISSCIAFAREPETDQPLTEEEKVRAMLEMFAGTYQEEDYFRTDRLLISATGSQKPVRLAPSIASVITAEDIEKMSATTLDEVLETVPGLHVVPSNLNRMNSNFSIRGILTKQNQQVLLLLDGIPIRIITNNIKPNTLNIPTTNIARVEVIRGPGSAVHGADAFAGTINIITKDAFNINGFKSGIRAGSFGYTENWLQYGAEHWGWNFSFSFDFLRSDGDTDRIVEQDALDANPIALTPGPLETDDRILEGQVNLLKGNWTIRFWSWIQNGGGLGAGAAQVLDPNGYHDENIFLADLLYNNSKLARNWDLSLHVYYLYEKQDTLFQIFPPGITLGLATYEEGMIGSPSTQQDTAALIITANYDGFRNHLLRFGSEYSYQDFNCFEKKNFGANVVPGVLTDVTGTPSVFMPDNTRDILSALFQDQWYLGKGWEFTGGVRYDYYDDFGETVNPRAALVWETRYDLTTKLLYGRAFRPPSFNETSITNNPSALGSKDIEPETIDTYELAFDCQPFLHLRTVLSLFTYRVDGLIDAISDPDATTSTYRNQKDLEGNGFELEMEWDAFDDLSFVGNFAHQRTKDKATGEVIPNTPASQFYGNIHWNFLTDWSLNGQYYWIGDRHRPNNDPRPDIKNNEIVNITLRRKNIAKHWDLALAVRNLFDENVREPSQPTIPYDYPMEGRSVWAEVRAHF